MGGMLFGTIFGVIIIPGLYYIFAHLADGRKLIKDEEDDSLSDNLVHQLDAFKVTEETTNHE
jgi:HAE1 family hydrophobic/amphiphilic exporter-1